MVINNKVYDVLKWIAMVLLPAVGTLYFALAASWHLGYGTSVVGSITALDTFLGVLLHLSSAAYNNSEAKYDGSVTVAEDDTTKTVALDFKDAHNIDQQKEVRLKVKSAKTAS